MMTRNVTFRRLMDMAMGGALATGLFCAVVQAQTKQAAPAAPEPVITKAAREIGVKRCLSSVAAIAQRAMIGASRQDILVDWNHRDPDGGPLFSLTAMNIGSASALVSLSVVPGPAGSASCSQAVERISATAQPCDVVARTSLIGYEARKFLENISVYVKSDRPNEVIILTSSENSCLVVRRQVRVI